MSDGKPLVPDQLLAPGVRDERQIAYVKTLDAALKMIDVSAFIMSDTDTIDARLLPYLVREFSLQEFLSTDLPERFVRRFLKRAYELHAKKGYVEGTRLGLRMLGVEVTWVQWWQTEPKGPPNTHKITAYVNEHIFADEPTLLNERVHKACLRIIDATKRWSQDIDFTIGAGFKSDFGLADGGSATGMMHAEGKTSIPGLETQLGVGVAFDGIGLTHLDGCTKLPGLSSVLGLASAGRAVSLLKIEGELVG